MSWYPNRTVVKLSGTYVPLKYDGKVIEICPVCKGKGQVVNRRDFEGCKKGEIRKCVACNHGLTGTTEAGETFKLINDGD